MIYRLLYIIKHCNLINHVVAVPFLDFYHAAFPSVMFQIYINVGYFYKYLSVGQL